MVRRSAGAAATFIVCSLLPAAFADQIIVNGNFNAGITAWTPFTTTDGTLGPGLPDVKQFPADTSMNGARFEVGQKTASTTAGNQGGGVFQDVSTTAGPLFVSVDVSAEGGASGNMFGGVAELLIDSQPVFGYDFGALQAGQIKSATLSIDEMLSAGTHSIGIQFLRPVTFDVNSPYQFATDFTADEDAPEPGTLALFVIGIAFLIWRRAQKLTIEAKDAGSRLAPPTSVPSISG